MPVNKNAYMRYMYLNQCFRNRHRRFSIDDLVDFVSEKLGYNISLRQIREDIANLRIAPYYAPIVATKYDGRKCYYHYADANFSIINNELTIEEITNLRSTIEMLGKYRGLPSNGWLEEVISNLEIRFGVKGNTENLISFGQNEQLKGLQYLSDIIDATINHQPLEIEYVSANGNYHQHTLHPYFVKQYNGRWYLFGLDEKEERIKNLAFDRIQKIEHSSNAFRKNEDIDFNSYFDNVVGVTVPYDAKLEEFQLKFSPQRFNYVTSKPIHKSQKTVSEKDCIISLTLYHTLELEQQIFSFGPDVEVLSPTWFREEFGKKIYECMKKYSSMQNDCIGNSELCSRNQSMDVKH